METKKLITQAINLLTNAYSPYSKFRVGAALLTGDGSVFLGCNIENASYPATICAERVAASAAIAAGKRDFVKIAIVADSDELCLPCGICRQFLYEFAPDMRIIAANKSGDYQEYTLRELYPYAFGRVQNVF
jgi:cytidine deaminase